MNAKEYFDKIDALNMTINIKKAQIAALRDSLGISSPAPDSEQVSHTRNVHVMADKIAAVVDTERETEAMADELLDLKTYMIDAINRLPNSKEALFLTERYINGKDSAEIAKETNYTRRWVQKFIKKGRDHLDELQIL